MPSYLGYLGFFVDKCLYLYVLLYIVYFLLNRLAVNLKLRRFAPAELASINELRGLCQPPINELCLPTISVLCQPPINGLRQPPFIINE